MNMEVVIRKEESIIDFRYPVEEDSRFIRIEMEILRKIGYLHSQLVEPGVRRLSQKPLRTFTEEHYDHIVEILKGYCLTPLWA